MTTDHAKLAQALADIAAIRDRLAEDALFQGFGPAVIAATGGLAALAAAAQLLNPALSATPGAFLSVWIGVGLLSAGLIGAEVFARSRRRHGGMADAMIWAAMERFLPAAVACVAVAAALWRAAPEALWLLPGLAHLLTGVGMFAAARTLPFAVRYVAGFYLLAGAAVLLWSAEMRALDPIAAAAPFIVGQFAAAWILHRAEKNDVVG